MITDTAYSVAAFTGVNQFGRTISPAVTYVSETSAAGTVSSAGLVTPVARGQTTARRHSDRECIPEGFRVDRGSDGDGTGGTHRTSRVSILKNDTTFTATVITDMPGTTLLGAATVTVTWDPTQLTYVSDADGSEAAWVRR